MIRTRKTEPLTWIVGHAPDRKSVPERFVPATVPGAVQLDMARAEGYPDYNRADNYRRMTWMEDRFFTYRAEFDAPGLGQDRQLWFVSKGIDYRYEIRLNDTLLLAREGMFAPVEIDLTPHLHPRNRLEILLFPVPKRAGMPDDRTQASASVKPAVGYGWDWHPRLWVSGTKRASRSAAGPTSGRSMSSIPSTTTCPAPICGSKAGARSAGNAAASGNSSTTAAAARPGPKEPSDNRSRHGWRTPGCGGPTTTGNPCCTPRATRSATPQGAIWNAWRSGSVSAASVW